MVALASTATKKLVSSLQQKALLKSLFTSKEPCQHYADERASGGLLADGKACSPWKGLRKGIAISGLLGLVVVTEYARRRDLSLGGFV